MAGFRITQKLSEKIATYLNQTDMQKIKDIYDKKYNERFKDFIGLLNEFENSSNIFRIAQNTNNRTLLPLALPVINKHLKSLLSKIGVLFTECSKKCTAKIRDAKTREQLESLRAENTYSFAQVCKTEKVQKCIQFMTLVGLFETKLAKVNKLVDSVSTTTPTRGRTPSSQRKSISPNISISAASRQISKPEFKSSPNISRDSLDDIQKFKEQYAKFLKMISRKMNGGKRRTKKKDGNR
jgi:hypothetical protein